GAAPYRRPPNSPLRPADPGAKPLLLVEVGEDSAEGALGPLTVIRSRLNRGFAGGVNLGLRALRGQADAFWILNPDCAVPARTAQTYAACTMANPGYGLMTGRTVYYDAPDQVQTAGGFVDRRTGVCRQRDAGGRSDGADADPAAPLDWVTGANMVVSPAFLEQAGLMREDYFLYYEEVDWAFRRGDLSIVFAGDAVVYHHGGTVIGPGSIHRRASPFANYFNHRNRIRFARRFLRRTPVAAYLYGLAKAGQLALSGGLQEAYAVIAGMYELAPPAAIRDRIGGPAAELAFAKVRP
ncbi:MAG: glycosyltransferase family 2 protein, partial [Caulobacteraceae bacterium]|nr:glycosyltransferase family 2 protein [Caulobacteraceae bacterium]